MRRIVKEIVEPTVTKEHENRSSLNILKKHSDDYKSRIEALEVAVLKKHHKISAFEEIYEKIALKV